MRCAVQTSSQSHKNDEGVRHRRVMEFLGVASRPALCRRLLTGAATLFIRDDQLAGVTDTEDDTPCGARSDTFHGFSALGLAEHERCQLRMIARARSRLACAIEHKLKTYNGCPSEVLDGTFLGDDGGRFFQTQFTAAKEESSASSCFFSLDEELGGPSQNGLLYFIEISKGAAEKLPSGCIVFLTPKEDVAENGEHADHESAFAAPKGTRMPVVTIFQGVFALRDLPRAPSAQTGASASAESQKMCAVLLGSARTPYLLPEVRTFAGLPHGEGVRRWPLGQRLEYSLSPYGCAPYALLEVLVLHHLRKENRCSFVAAVQAATALQCPLASHLLPMLGGGCQLSVSDLRTNAREKAVASSEVLLTHLSKSQRQVLEVIQERKSAHLIVTGPPSAGKSLLASSSALGTVLTGDRVFLAVPTLQAALELAEHPALPPGSKPFIIGGPPYELADGQAVMPLTRTQLMELLSNVHSALATLQATFLRAGILSASTAWQNNKVIPAEISCLQGLLDRLWKFLMDKKDVNRSAAETTFDCWKRDFGSLEWKWPPAAPECRMSATSSAVFTEEVTSLPLLCLLWAGGTRLLHRLYLQRLECAAGEAYSISSASREEAALSKQTPATRNAGEPCAAECKHFTKEANTEGTGTHWSLNNFPESLPLCVEGLMALASLCLLCDYEELLVSRVLAHRFIIFPALQYRAPGGAAAWRLSQFWEARAAAWYAQWVYIDDANFLPEDILSLLICAGEHDVMASSNIRSDRFTSSTLFVPPICVPRACRSPQLVLFTSCIEEKTLEAAITHGAQVPWKLAQLSKTFRFSRHMFRLLKRLARDSSFPFRATHSFRADTSTDASELPFGSLAIISSFLLPQLCLPASLRQTPTSLFELVLVRTALEQFATHSESLTVFLIAFDAQEVLFLETLLQGSPELFAVHNKTSPPSPPASIRFYVGSPESFIGQSCDVAFLLLSCTSFVPCGQRLPPHSGRCCPFAESSVIIGPRMRLAVTRAHKSLILVGNFPNFLQLHKEVFFPLQQLFHCVDPMRALSGYMPLKSLNVVLPTIYLPLEFFRSARELVKLKPTNSSPLPSTEADRALEVLDAFLRALNNIKPNGAAAFWNVFFARLAQTNSSGFCLEWICDTIAPSQNTDDEQPNGHGLTPHILSKTAVAPSFTSQIRALEEVLTRAPSWKTALILMRSDGSALEQLKQAVRLTDGPHRIYSFHVKDLSRSTKRSPDNSQRARETRRSAALTGRTRSPASLHPSLLACISAIRKATTETTGSSTSLPARTDATMTKVETSDGFGRLSFVAHAPGSHKPPADPQASPPTLGGQRQAFIVLLPSIADDGEAGMQALEYMATIAALNPLNPDLGIFVNCFSSPPYDVVFSCRSCPSLACKTRACPICYRLHTDLRLLRAGLCFFGLQATLVLCEQHTQEGPNPWLPKLLSTLQGLGLRRQHTKTLPDPMIFGSYQVQGDKGALSAFPNPSEKTRRSKRNTLDSTKMASVVHWTDAPRPPTPPIAFHDTLLPLDLESVHLQTKNRLAKPNDILPAPTVSSNALRKGKGFYHNEFARDDEMFDPRPTHWPSNDRIYAPSMPEVRDMDERICGSLYDPQQPFVADKSKRAEMIKNPPPAYVPATSSSSVYKPNSRLQKRDHCINEGRHNASVPCPSQNHYDPQNIPQIAHRMYRPPHDQKIYEPTMPIPYSAPEPEFTDRPPVRPAQQDFNMRSYTQQDSIRQPWDNGSQPRLRHQQHSSGGLINMPVQPSPPLQMAPQMFAPACPSLLPTPSTIRGKQYTVETSNHRPKQFSVPFSCYVCKESPRAPPPSTSLPSTALPNNGLPVLTEEELCLLPAWQLKLMKGKALERDAVEAGKEAEKAWEKHLEETKDDGCVDIHMVRKANLGSWEAGTIAPTARSQAMKRGSGGMKTRQGRRHR